MYTYILKVCAFKAKNSTFENEFSNCILAITSQSYNLNPEELYSYRVISTHALRMTASLF